MLNFAVSKIFPNFTVFKILLIKMELNYLIEADMIKDGV